MIDEEERWFVAVRESHFIFVLSDVIGTMNVIVRHECNLKLVLKPGRKRPSGVSTFSLLPIFLQIPFRAQRDSSTDRQTRPRDSAGRGLLVVLPRVDFRAHLNGAVSSASFLAPNQTSAEALFCGEFEVAKRDECPLRQERLFLHAGDAGSHFPESRGWRILAKVQAVHKYVMGSVFLLVANHGISPFSVCSATLDLSEHLRLQLEE